MSKGILPGFLRNARFPIFRAMRDRFIRVLQRLPCVLSITGKQPRSGAVRQAHTEQRLDLLVLVVRRALCPRVVQGLDRLRVVHDSLRAVLARDGLVPKRLLGLGGREALGDPGYVYVVYAARDFVFFLAARILARNQDIVREIEHTQFRDAMRKV